MLFNCYTFLLVFLPVTLLVFQWLRAHLFPIEALRNNEQEQSGTGHQAPLSRWQTRSSAHGARADAKNHRKGLKIRRKC